MGRPRRRTDGNTAQHVAENQRLSGKPSEYAACDGGKEDCSEVSKKYGVGLHVTPILREFYIGLTMADRQQGHKTGEQKYHKGRE